LPIEGHDEPFVYGVWSSLSEASFERIYKLWEDPRRTEEPAYFGWLSNQIPGYPDTLNLPADVVTDDLGLRPQILLHDGEHPLVAEQRAGITFERAVELDQLNLHSA
jgi:hypothetical protein